MEMFKSLVRFMGLGPFVRMVRKWLYRIYDYIGDLVFSPGTGGIKRGAIEKILIIRIDRIGDLILSTPAIRAVKESCPDASINLLINGYTEDLVINNPNVDKIIRYGKDRLDSDFDLAVALHPGVMPNRLTYESGARFRIGYEGSGGSFYLTHRLKDDRDLRIRHEVESALEVVSVAGFTTKKKTIEVSVTEKGEQYAEHFFREYCPDKKPVIIHPGARQKYIRWKEDGFAKVADKLIGLNEIPVILLAGPGEDALIERIAGQMKHEPVIADRLRLTETVSIIKRCALFIGNSTGTMHIANGLGIPVVAIFGNIHPLDSFYEWGPWEAGSMVVHKAVNCPSCHPGDCRKLKCMQFISVKDVYRAALRLLEC